MFRQGLGVYMRQELTSLARDFLQQPEPRTPYPQPRRPDIIPPDKYAMTAEHFETESKADAEELLNITQLSDEELSDSDNEEWNEIVNEYLESDHPKSSKEFIERFGNRSLDGIFDLPNIDEENRKYLVRLAKNKAMADIVDRKRSPATMLVEPSSGVSDTNVIRDSIKQPEALTAQDIILQHPSACIAAMDNDDTFSIIWDSGASMCISGDKRDFIGKITPVKNAVVNGIVSGLKIEGTGRVRWSLLDVEGKLRHLVLPAYYVPKT